MASQNGLSNRTEYPSQRNKLALSLLARTLREKRFAECGKPICGAGVAELARLAAVRVIADVFGEKVGMGAASRSTTNVASEIAVLLRPVSQNCVNMPLRPQPLPISRDQGNWI